MIPTVLTYSATCIAVLLHESTHFILAVDYEYDDNRGEIRIGDILCLCALGEYRPWQFAELDLNEEELEAVGQWAKLLTTIDGEWLDSLQADCRDQIRKD